MDNSALIIAIIGGLLGSGAAVSALITQIGTAKKQKREIAAKREDAESSDIKAIKHALTYVMLDRIRDLGQRYIDAGQVDFDDRRILNEMHTSYHDGLDGNGDLDILMRQVNELPLKTGGQ